MNGKFPSVCISFWASATEPRLTLLTLQNKQIDRGLNSILLSRPLSNPSPKLSAQSREIVEDFREVIANAKNLILVKNEGNLIQEFFWDVANTDYSGVQRPQGIMGREAVKDHGQQTAEGLKTLGTLIVTNGQFRKLCKRPPAP